MNDPAFELLLDALTRETGATRLWVVDENLAPAALQRIVPGPALTAVTNRIDISERLQRTGVTTELSDFQFTRVPTGTVDCICFRVGKEKAIVHHVINRAAILLRPGGRLLLAGCKNEGIKTYIDKAARRLGGIADKHRGGKTSMLAIVQRGEVLGEALDDRNYCEPVILEAGSDVTLVSKPGVFGWNKIDRGSEFLISQLSQCRATLAEDITTVVDLGCGYGYLSVMASRLIAARYVATDNNIAAVAMCRENFARHAIAGEVVLADCGDGVRERADLLLCNPPFHQGFSVDSELTGHFLHAARRLLAARGTALFVVNSFIPIERAAQKVFNDIEQLANNGQFKVITLRA